MERTFRDLPAPQGLYDPSFEHDACGIGFVVNIKGERSYDIVYDALDILENLKHRGGEGADHKSGDGAGIMVQIPHAFLSRECAVLGFDLPPEGQYGVGMVFAHRYDSFRQKQIKAFERIVREEGQTILGWREVPVDDSCIGEEAASVRPRIIQVFIGRSPDLKDQMDFERKLYVIRRLAEKQITPASKEMGTDFYIASLSSHTIVYKGMLTAAQIRHFYLDLSDLDFTSAMALVHSRFSTNTFPSWARAHPNRYIVHNGEINTIRGNTNWLNARESKAHSLKYPELDKVFPVVDATGSDSSMFDNCLEYLYMSGHSLAHAMMTMIPEPWEKDPLMSQEKRDYYRYQNFMMEAWDGPAAICFCDGTRIGGMLDRNGLRPARYYVTKDDRVVLVSEVGAVRINPKDILCKGRLEPGRLFLVDTEQKRIVPDEEIKHIMASAHPYGDWCAGHLVDLPDLMRGSNENFFETNISYDIREQQKVFGYTKEDLAQILIPMARTGKESIGAMGMDCPLPVLSEKPQMLYDYFQQNFAQVTNPPMDALRENIVTSTSVMIGNVANIMDPDEKGTYALAVSRPLLTNREMAVIKNLQNEKLRTVTLSMLYPVNGGAESMETAIESLCIDALRAVKTGANIVVLSDRGVNSRMAAVPALLATAAVHNYLVKETVRPDVGLILESGEPREVHHFCTLIGYGITAINPYLALETIKDLAVSGKLSKMSYQEAQENYLKAAVAGIQTVISKMGISTVRSYHGAQIFEAVGISKDVINKYFVNTPSRIEGLGLKEIAKENEMRHQHAFHGDSDLADGDIYMYKKGGPEPHILDPEAIAMLQEACRTGDTVPYRKFADKVNNDAIFRLRDLLEFDYPDGCSIPIEEVEPVNSIVKRFRTGAMSYGALSKEAHECIAIAMNRLGGRSNTGEGGEDPARFTVRPDGDDPNDAIKQVSTARFGVTGNYLVHARELQIKCAQGAKPGQGGNLPGKKVFPAIGRTRHSTPGVALISPPPHHDIYSIEDLAELIYDLKNVNKDAEINVKLTAGSGIGTIAAGVVKTKADGVTVCGFDGGTGASPRSSMRHAGLPWELGLSEVQQTLLLNRLRDRVKLAVDGKLLTGRDVAIAALFGAELFDFCTGPLVALGCHMLRVCNLNTCPFGVCTQDEKLRKRFAGKPEYVINYLRFVAQDLREIMARLGFHTVEEMVGRYDRLKQKENITNWKAATVSLDRLLFRPYTDNTQSHHFVAPQDHEIEQTLDQSKLVRMCKPALEEKKQIRARLRIDNTNRVTGTLLGSGIFRRYGDEGLPEDTIRLSFVGSAGQSFGAFIPKGLTLLLEGDANDYLGKGLSGGKIAVFPPREADFTPSENIIIGNVACFGATGGEVFINGQAGERFCVRNSGATAVVEGIGNHGCEYMTGGTVVVLGPVGRNFAAGMSGGTAYVLDLQIPYCNQELVNLEEVSEPEEKQKLRGIVERHAAMTGSPLAQELLQDWDQAVERFTRVIPRDYEEMQRLIQKYRDEGRTESEAEEMAFQEKNG
ncbi:MAG TPA: glutamate synthase large subunit [Acidaminococcaceae bacterium]|nr:glutamate synthase large subunit [Acidaminococcaceae bacterium]